MVQRVSIFLKGYHRTFSVDCLSNEEPKPIVSLDLNATLTTDDPPVITNLKVDILPSLPIDSKQALSVAADVSYENPRFVGVERSTALYETYNITTKKYDLVDGSLNILTKTLFVTPSDLSTDIITLNSRNVLEKEPDARTDFNKPNLIENSLYFFLRDDKKIIILDSEKKSINAVVAAIAPTSVSFSVKTIDYIGVTESMQKFIVDASAFLT